MLLNRQQKQLMLDILQKEKRRLFSKHKGKLLDQTINDLKQTLRNEAVNSNDPRR
jgi:hypothetical protein